MKKAIIAVSFGTSYETALSKSVKRLESDFKSEFPEYDIYIAFTSRMIISSLRQRGIKIDTVSEVLKKLSENAFEEVIIQPTHLISGEEYEKMCREAEEYKENFSVLKIGKPLLYDRCDLKNVCEFFYDKFCVEGAALVLMGHGTEHRINKVYAEMNDVCSELGYENVFIGTVEAVPEIKDVISEIKKKNYTSVKLTPLMFVAGDHAHNDMAGDDSESWRSLLEAAGISTETIIKGMGEYSEIRHMYIEHLRSLIMEVQKV